MTYKHILSRNLLCSQAQITKISDSLKTTENFKPRGRENGNLDQYSGLEMKERLEGEI